MRAMHCAIPPAGNTTVDEFDLSELDRERFDDTHWHRQMPPRLWVAHRDGEVVAAVEVTCQNEEIAHVHCDLPEAQCDRLLSRDLLTLAFQYCRRRGVLKVIVFGRPSGALYIAAKSARLQLWRKKTGAVHTTVEFLVGLYRDDERSADPRYARQRMHP